MIKHHNTRRPPESSNGALIAPAALQLTDAEYIIQRLRRHRRPISPLWAVTPANAALER
jgi:hypothetical protein